jgi:SAM-dependent methyltransferase
MTHEFDREYWRRHWGQSRGGGPEAAAANPYLVREVSGLTPGTALDAGCGEGAETIWLATHGWRVTAADIAAEPLGRAASRAAGKPVQWVEADLTEWEPGTQFDLVTTSYAHPAMPQLAFYQRISAWVAPGGTLLIVGHLHTGEPSGEGHEHGDHPPAHASVTAADITAALDDDKWEIVTAEEHSRDAVVRATRRA